MSAFVLPCSVVGCETGGLREGIYILLLFQMKKNSFDCPISEFIFLWSYYSPNSVIIYLISRFSVTLYACVQIVQFWSVMSSMVFRCMSCAQPGFPTTRDRNMYLLTYSLTWHTPALNLFTTRMSRNTLPNALIV